MSKRRRENDAGNAIRLQDMEVAIEELSNWIGEVRVTHPNEDPLGLPLLGGFADIDEPHDPQDFNPPPDPASDYRLSDEPVFAHAIANGGDCVMPGKIIIYSQ
jgi:hypothetical protein